MVTKARHIFCLALEATLNWQSSEHQMVNSRLAPEGLCSHMHPLPAVVTSSNKDRLFNENFFLFQWLFHLFCNWHKIAHGLSLLRSSISYSLKLSLPLSCHWKFTLPYHICFATSFQFGIFPLLTSCNSLPVPSSLSHCPGSLCAHHSLTVGMPPQLSPLQSSSDLTHFQILIISFL